MSDYSERNANQIKEDILLAQCTADSVAELFKAIRKIRKMTILEVSEKSGINRNTIGAIESGEAINDARINTLAKIAQAINCDLQIQLIPYENFTEEKNDNY